MPRGTAPDRTPKRPRPGFFNPFVHGARGLFALAVLVFHAANSELPGFAALQSGLPRAALLTLEFGVELFFCISGFVILGALRRAPGPGAFLRDRAIRIYPVLWASVLVMGVFGFLTRTREFAGATMGDVLALLPANLLALPGVVPMWAFHPAAWSLSYELVFYALCAAAWWLRPRIGGIAAVLLWAPVAAVLLVLHPRALFFVAGVLAAEGIIARIPGAARLARFPLPLLLVFLAAWGGVQALSAPRHLSETTLADWVGDARLPLALLAFAAAALAFQGIVEGRGALGRLLLSRPMQWLGTVSYSLYLWHLPAMGVVRRVMAVSGLTVAAGPTAQLVFLLLSLPLSLALAHASHRLLEVRFAAWARARLGRTPAVGEAALEATDRRRSEPA